MRAGIHTDRGSRGEGAGARNPAAEALIAAGRWRCFVNGCGVESTLGLALSRASVASATLIRNLVSSNADPLFVPVRVSVTQRNPDSRISFRLAPARECGSEATFTKNPHVGRRRGLLYVGKDPQGQC